jgi:hypothetical protein
MTGRQRVFGVFYRDYAHEVAVSSARPESLLADRIPALAERLLVNADNYLGVVDRNDVILQLYREDDSQVEVELLRPNTPAYLHCVMSLPEVLALLADLPEVFDASLLPGAELIDGED